METKIFVGFEATFGKKEEKLVIACEKTEEKKPQTEKKHCIACVKEIDKDAKFCMYCHISQDIEQAKRQGVAVKPCTHCAGTGDCKHEEAVGVKFACESCLKKADIKSHSPFPQAPCSICNGVGATIIDLKIKETPRPRPQYQGRNPYQGGQHGKR